jgi:hypothetical protein
LRQGIGCIGRRHFHGTRPIPVQHAKRRIAVLPVGQLRFSHFGIGCRRQEPVALFLVQPAKVGSAKTLDHNRAKPMLAHQPIVRRIAEAAHVLARRALHRIGPDQS